jgi:hypothetical protein|nr:MAG TPA: Structural Protein [Caudoviricetes sp.]
MATEIYISNATPHSNHLGTKDLSARVVDRTPLLRPMFLPYFPFFGRKGTLDEVMVDGAAFESIYGSETLDERSPYFNHASVFIKGILNAGGKIIAKRIVPEKDRKYASLRVSLEYVETQVDEYVRDPSGHFKLNNNNENETTGRKVPGALFRFHVEEIPTVTLNTGAGNIETFQFGMGAQSVSDLTDGTGQVGKRVPLFDFVAPSPGEHGNLNGMALWAPTTISPSPVNYVPLNDAKAYPYRLRLVTKPTSTSSPAISYSRLGMPEIDFCLKPEARSKAGVDYHIGDVFLDSYNDLIPENPLVPPTYGPFSRLHVYQENVDSVLSMLVKKETDVEKIGDLTNVTDENINELRYLFNVLGGQHSDGTPYQTYRRATIGGAATPLGENTYVWAKGGRDPEMTDALFEAEVDALLKEFEDPNSKYMDEVQFNDSVFIDTGYSLDFKRKMGRYLANRKDRWVLATTYVHDEKPISAAEELGRISMIAGAIRRYPDSQIHGTSAFRCVVAKGSGLLAKSVSSYKKRVPVTYEIAVLLTKYWGAGNGIANSRWDWSEGSNNKFNYLIDVTSGFVPYQVRNGYWAAGGMWAQQDERKTSYFPAYRTIFDDDTSTLTNMRTMLVHVDINKIGAEMQRVFSGKDWTQDRMKQEMTEWFYDQLKGNKYGGKVEINVKITFTKMDVQRGYSWHTEVTVFSDHFYTVQTFESINRRRSDKTVDDDTITA